MVKFAQIWCNWMQVAGMSLIWSHWLQVSSIVISSSSHEWQTTKNASKIFVPSLTQWPTLFRQTAGNGLWPFFNRGHRKLFTWTWTDLFNSLSSHFFCPYLNWVFYLHYTKYSTLKKDCLKFVNNFLYPELILWWKFQGKTLIF